MDVNNIEYLVTGDGKYHCYSDKILARTKGQDIANNGFIALLFVTIGRCLPPSDTITWEE
jgi:hypothetical protein